MTDALSATTLTLIRKLADAIVASANKPITNAPQDRMTWAVVVSVDATIPNPTLTLRIAGAATTSGGIAYISSYSPRVGDTVYGAWYGSDLVVLGSITSIATTGLWDTKTYSIMGAIVPTTNALTTPPPQIWHFPAGQATLLLGYATVLVGTTGGDSATFDFQDNGTAVPGMSGLVATTTLSYADLPTPYPVSDYHAFGPIFNSVTGTPAGLAISTFWSSL